MKVRWMEGVGLILGSLIGMLAACTPQSGCRPALTVTTTEDTNDGVCSEADCSLREAVLNANSCPGPQTIYLPDGAYILTVDGSGEDAGESGDLDLRDDLDIIGIGTPSIQAGIERAFQIHEGVTAHFEGIKLAGGKALLGGGLINEGDLTLSAFTCQDNSAVIPAGGVGEARGGCIFNTGTLTVQDGHFQSNTAGFGGAIYNLGQATARIEKSTFAGNRSEFQGGALWNGPNAELILSNGSIENSAAGQDGGAIWNHGNLNGEGLVLERNLALGKGGAVYNWVGGQAEFTNSWIKGNQADLGGGLYNDNGLAHLDQSGLTENTASGAGGGIYNRGVSPTNQLALENVTLSDNAAGRGAGGGGIYNDGNFDLRFITVAGNSPEGLRIEEGTESRIRSSILADNPGGDCAGETPDSQGFNLDSDGSCGFSGPHDLSGVDPLLEPLGSYGGTAPSRPLGLGSPAIDSGPPGLCLAADQNAAPRPQGGGCDRGAFENTPPGGGISGWTYIDVNRNDIRDAGDGLMSGVQVDIHAGGCPPTGALVATAASDSSGHYQALDLPAVNYCLETSPGQGTLYPDEIDAIVVAGDSLSEVNFRYLLSPLGSGSIRGKVWHDLCTAPGSDEGTPPPGCTELPDGDMGGDGQYDPAEPGIEGIKVSIYTGTCPPQPAALAGTTLTQANGDYSLAGLESGAWCLAIDAQTAPKDQILIPGRWTFPISEGDLAVAQVDLAEGEALSGVDFGWDYQLLPNPEPTPQPGSLSGKFIADAPCRSGPGTVYETLMTFESGTAFEILARSETHLPLWLYIEDLILKARCWISSSTAEFSAPLEGIPTRTAPSTPTPGPTQPICYPDLMEEACQAAGGAWQIQGGTSPSRTFCECPDLK